MAKPTRHPPARSVRARPACAALAVAASLAACAAPRPLPPAPVAAPAESLLATAERVHRQVVGVSGRAEVVVPIAEGRAALHLLEAAGSGVLIGPGLVATSLHLVVLPDGNGRLRPADAVDVYLGGASPVRADVARIFPAMDLALLRVDTSGAAAAQLATEGAAPAQPLLALSDTGGRLAAAAVACDSVEPEGDGPGLIRLDDLGLGNRFLGGPVFSADGKLQGLLISGSGGTTGALPAAALRQALEVDLHASADAL